MLKGNFIKISNVDDDIVERIDLRYKKLGYKSRNEFLLHMLKEIALGKEKEKIFYAELKKREVIVNAINYNSKVLAHFLKENGLNIDDLYKSPNLKSDDFEFELLDGFEIEKDEVGTEEIRIRKVKKSVVKRLDYLFKKSNFKNRNEFLLDMLEGICIRHDIKSFKLDEEYRTNKFEKILELNTEAIIKFIEFCFANFDMEEFYE
ncbi:hypothetical protein [Clostridium perfringens]|uniref:hypothetical protein n=1 Tax=Clostridium perfringens TaxID=1502 RepID=UPI0024BD550A|nr:hypothetical protein [Clostridium perfringens]